MPAPSSQFLQGLKQENIDLLSANSELQQLVKEAAQLFDRAEQIRSRPSSASTPRDMEKLQEDSDFIRRRAVQANSRPTSAGSSRSWHSMGAAPGQPRPKSALKKGPSRPVSATHARSGHFDPAVQMAADVAASAKEQQSGATFVVELDKSGGASLGMKIRTAGDVLEVTKVKDDGLVTQWNTQNPTVAVKRGDRILEVNGKRGNADVLFQECMQDAVLRLVVSGFQQLEGASPLSPSAERGSPAWCRAKLGELLEKNDRAVLANLDALLEKFKGRELDLYRSLCKKYGEHPSSP
mmetsp:Transcript_21995/g.56027  ORF Transcript_21995/g.56027 Transcript_21995/m.56027 type:complete len:295 (+) Transcript_21995:1-885(+)